MCVTNPQMLRPRVADARAAVRPSPGNAEWPRVLTAHIAKAVRREDLVGFAKTVVYSNVERILIVYDILVRKIVVGKRSGIRRLRIEVRHSETNRIKANASGSALPR